MNSRSHAPQEIIEAALELADLQIQDMDDDECILMVRSYVETMADWQPELARLGENPTDLALAVLTLNQLFLKAFKKAYSYTERRLEATEALERAFKS